MGGHGPARATNHDSVGDLWENARTLLNDQYGAANGPRVVGYYVHFHL
jgi:hypothetical protein